MWPKHHLDWNRQLVADRLSLDVEIFEFQLASEEMDPELVGVHALDVLAEEAIHYLRDHTWWTRRKSKPWENFASDETRWETMHRSASPETRVLLTFKHGDGISDCDDGLDRASAMLEMLHSKLDRWRILYVTAESPDVHAVSVSVVVLRPLQHRLSSMARRIANQRC